MSSTLSNAGSSCSQASVSNLFSTLELFHRHEDATQASTTDDPRLPLREDVKFLGELLGLAIRQVEGEAVYEHIEAVRSLSKAARNGDEQARLEIGKLLASFDDVTLALVARAFGHFLNLANIAEEHHLVRCRRLLQHRQQSEKGDLSSLLSMLNQSKGQASSTVLQQLESFNIELVLTAHPTEVARRTMIRHFNDISALLSVLDSEGLTPLERQQASEKVAERVLALWQTEEFRLVRPTPLDEARWAFTAVEQTFWTAIPSLLRQVDEYRKQEKLPPLKPDQVLFKLGSWMGGDRDGNPNVTHTITRKVCLLSQWKAIDLFKADIIDLRQQLSYEKATPQLIAEAGSTFEPYRALLKQLLSQLDKQQNWIETALNDTSVEVKQSSWLSLTVLLQPLQLCYDSLMACNLQLAAQGALLDTLRRCYCFGMHLLPLDIRQDAQLHQDLLSEITKALDLGDYAQWTESQKITFLLKELQEPRPLLPLGFTCKEAMSQEVLDTFKLLPVLGGACFNQYVISMAHHASDVLAVYLLQKATGAQTYLPVSPLFETLDALTQSSAIIDSLLSLDFYKILLADGQQQVMLGYSDSAKDAGLMAASWAQYQAQEQLLMVCKRHQVELVLFHGRGGSVSRGGVPAHQAMLSQPPGILNGKIRVTEQGEVIRYKYANPEIAVHNLELYLSAMLEAMNIQQPQPTDQWRQSMQKLADGACQGYRRVVKEDPLLLEYFNQVTPQAELQKLPMSSRPARRKKGVDLSSLRAIPWVFAWTQIRLMLPAWLGSGSALANVIDAGELEQLRQLYQQWPFFRSVIDMIEMVLAKSDESITLSYEAVLGNEQLKALGDEWRAELNALTRDLNTLKQQSTLMVDYPLVGDSIALRNPYVDPINWIQIELTRRLRSLIADEAQGEQAARRETVQRGLMITVAGVAAGMRNTG